MDSEALRAVADRCRELGRIAVRGDVRAQLRQWAEEFDREADDAERSATRRRPVSVMPSG